MNPAVLWGPGLMVAATLLGWLCKKLFWDPIAELKAQQAAWVTLQATFVTKAVLDVEVQDLNRTMNSLRKERAEGEKRVLADIQTMRSENAKQRDEVRQDVQNLVQRVDTVMRAAARMNN